eukprot:scaffold51727_cov23-Tisochrysis_lutea.AAC.3
MAEFVGLSGCTAACQVSARLVSFFLSLPRSEAFSPCGNAPLAIVASALMHGDPVADPGWVMQ